MSMERWRTQLSQSAGYLDESNMGLLTSEANPTGRSGPIPGYPVGSTFSSRAACSKARVHGRTIAGIHGSKAHGAYSICLSGGYEDDIDEGDFIMYTGTGGQPDFFNRSGTSDESPEQRGDQTFDHPDNAALAMNVTTERPVRVIRGPNRDSRYAPDRGYRYDGLYTVEKAYLTKGASGHQICRYELRRLPNQPPIPT